MIGPVRLIMRTLDLAVGAFLAAMVVLVFANVVARYGFSSGIAFSDEVSRFCFVWLVFLGTIVAMRERAHLGVDTVVRMLPPMGRKLCLALNIVLMLFGCWVLGQGSWHHMVLSHSNVSPVSGIPLSYMFAAGVVSSAAVAAVLVGDAWLLVTGKLTDEELVQVTEEKG